MSPALLLLTCASLARFPLAAYRVAERQVGKRFRSFAKSSTCEKDGVEGIFTSAGLSTQGGEAADVLLAVRVS